MMHNDGNSEERHPGSGHRSRRRSRSSGGYGYGYGSPPSGYGGYGGSGYGGSGYGGSGYGGSGYGGYGYGGYGYGGSRQSGGGGHSRAKSLKDYVTIFRERIWVFILTFLVIFIGATIYTFQATELYRGITSLRILRAHASATGEPVQKMDPDQVVNVEDLKTKINILESATVVRAVAARLKDEQLKTFMAPYEDVIRFQGPLTPIDVLVQNRSIIPRRQSLTVDIIFVHPDGQLAADIANLFAEEFIAHNLRSNVDVGITNMDALKIKVDQKRSEVEGLEQALADYKERHHTVSFHEDSDVDRLELHRLKDQEVLSRAELDQAESQYRSLREHIEEKKPLWELPFIGELVLVKNLRLQVSQAKIALAQLKERYRSKHPSMIAAVNTLNEAETALEDAVSAAANASVSLYQTINERYEKIQVRMAAQEEKIIKQDKLRVEYNNIKRELEVAQAVYQGMLQRMAIVSADTSTRRPSINVIDKAVRSPYPFSPNHVMNICIGFAGGVFAGIILVLGLAFMDDRVKSTIDVETQLGVDMLGVIPRVPRLDSFEKARLSSTNSHRRVAEAFRSIYSTLQINEIAKNAQVIISTSTLPSEGKSFVTTNLAFVYASHGERTLVIDGDLRMPAIAQSLELENQIRLSGGGLVGYFEGGADWENIIISDVAPNLDVLASSRKARKPTEILNSEHFADIIAVYREHYDRILIDTPPLGVVSDTLSMFKIADGCVYVVKHNTVRIRNAKTTIKRMLDSQVPMFGVVMNQVSSAGSGYYSSYYAKPYDNYYGDHGGSGEEFDNGGGGGRKPDEAISREHYSG